MIKPTKKGFASTEGLILLIVIVLIGLGGWYVWHENHKTIGYKDHCLKGFCFTYPENWSVKNYYINPIFGSLFASPDKKVQIEYTSSTYLHQQILCDSSNCSFLPIKIEDAPNLENDLVIEGVVSQGYKIEPVIFMTSSSLLSQSSISLKVGQSLNITNGKGIPTATIKPTNLQSHNNLAFSVGINSHNGTKTIAEAKTFLKGTDAVAALKIVESTKAQ